MREVKIVGVLLAVLMVSASADVAAQTEKEQQSPQKEGLKTEEIVSAVNRFGLELYRQLAQKQKGKNLFISPLSVSAVLTMVYAGARGETAKQMRQTLHLPDSQDVHKSLAGLIKTLIGSEKCRLTIAGAVWMHKDETLLDKFAGLLRDVYGTPPQKTDFKNADEAAKKINDWIAKQTNNQIKSIMNPDQISSLTVLVVVNGVHFRGKWLTTFNRKCTHKADFFITKEKVVKVDMMRMRDELNNTKFNYAHLDGLKVVELPFEGEEFVMDFLLPEEREGLAALEKRLTPENLKKWLGGMKRCYLGALMIPRFMISEGTVRLKEVLKRLGMESAFGESADFSGVTGENDLFLGDVLHRTFVKVNEKGVDAGAGTAAWLYRYSLRLKKEFIANHPFLFLIRHKKTGAILFVGRLVDPTKAYLPSQIPKELEQEAMKLYAKAREWELRNPHAEKWEKIAMYRELLLSKLKYYGTKAWKKAEERVKQLLSLPR